MITPASFVESFPEFSDSTTYPPARIQLEISAAYGQLNASRFGSQLDLAASLFVAHYLVLAARQNKAALQGGIPGQAAAPQSSKTVGPVSASYDTQAAAIEGAGLWNSTVYGQRLYKMMQQYCLGPVYRPRTYRGRFRL